MSFDNRKNGYNARDWTDVSLTETGPDLTMGIRALSIEQPQFRPRRWWALGGIMLGIVLLCFAACLPQAWFVDVGAHDTRFALDFHEPEPLAGVQVRWTSAHSTLALPGRVAWSAHVLTMRMINARPATAPAAVVQLALDDRTLGAFDVPTGTARRYHMLLPADLRADWALRVALAATPFSSKDDPRPLGVVLDWARLAPITWLAAPDPWLLVVCAALCGLGYALPRRAGLAPRAALALMLGGTALLAVLVALRPLETLPFLPRLAALLGLALLAVSVARLLAPPQSVAHGLHIAGRDLPIYLAVAPWFGPLFEWVETLDGVDGVTPPPATALVFGLLVLALLALGVWAAIRGRAMPREQCQGIVRRAALTVFAGAALAHLATMLVFALGRNAPDFWILFKGARDWARGGSLYNIGDVLANHFGKVFKVPPFYGMMFVPFVFQDGNAVLLGHRILNIVILTTTAVLWYRMWHVRVFSTLGAAFLILLNFRPLADTIAYGQIDLLLLLLLTLALWALRRERGLLAGVLVALGTLFKIYPLLLLAFFVAKRQWRAVAGFALGMLVFNGLAVLVMGWPVHREYLFDVLPNIGGTTSWVENQTISGVIARFVDLPNQSEIFANPLLARLGLLVSGGLGLIACLLALPHVDRRGATYALQYGQFLLIMVLAVPAAWMHYETLLFMPFAALVLYFFPRTLPLPVAVVLATSFALISYGNQWSYYTGQVMGVLTVAGVSYKAWGMLLLGGVLGGVLVRAWYEQRVAAQNPLPDAALRQKEAGGLKALLKPIDDTHR